MVPTFQLVPVSITPCRCPWLRRRASWMDATSRKHFGVGASAAALGTAFLTCPESGASEAYKRAVLAAGKDTTVITRAFSGRPARGLRNVFITRMTGKKV